MPLRIAFGLFPRTHARLRPTRATRPVLSVVPLEGRLLLSSVGLDPTFGGGKATIAFDLGQSNFGAARGVAVQADGRIVVAGDFGVARLNADGSPDASFGVAGRATIDLGGNDTASGVAIQADGRIVVVGTVAGDFGVARLNADGSPDASFGVAGRATIDLGGNDTASGVAIQADGRIIVVGSNEYQVFRAVIPIRFVPVVARLNADGSPDASFGVAGRATIDLGGRGSAVAIQADGRIVVVGSSGSGDIFSGFEADFAVARLNADGTPDTSFDGDGRATIDLGRVNAASGVVIQADGRIVVVGSVGSGSNVSGLVVSNFGVARLNADGTPDATFDGDGRATVGLGGPASGVAIQADGRIVVVGTVTNTHPFGSTTTSVVARLNADGTPDASLDGDGRVAIDLDSLDDARGVAIQADGRIVVVGTVAGDFGVARLNADGTPDASFDGDGRAAIGLGGPASGVAIQADGRIVVVGTVNGSLLTYVVRLNADGSPDASFGGDGRATIDLGGPASGVAIQADGRIVVVGNFINPQPFSFISVVARLNADGTPDASFGGDGRAVIDLGGYDTASGVAIQADGRIVVVGSAGSLSIVSGFAVSSIGVARLNADGSPDASFGVAGRATVGLGGPASGVAIQADGRIVVVGSSGTPGTNIVAGGFEADFTVARLNADGTPDTSFGVKGRDRWGPGRRRRTTHPASRHGRVIIDLGGYDIASGVAIQADGRIVVVGSSGSGSIADGFEDSDFGVARLNADGSPDASFGVAGRATIDLGGNDTASGVAIQADGRIVVVGTTQISAINSDFAVIRLEPMPVDRTPLRLMVADFSFTGNGRRRKLAGFSLTFSEALDPITTRAGSFRLATRRIGRNGKLVTGPIRIVGTSYDPASHTVTLKPDRRARFPQGGRIEVLPALTDLAGNALDGIGTGTAGSKAVVIIPRSRRP